MRLFLLMLLLALQGLPMLSQNTVNYYDFAGLPQSLLVNPSYNMGRSIHVGIPLLNNINFDLGSSGLTVYDIFADNKISINEKLKKAIYTTSNHEAFLVNQKLDIINIGYKLDPSTYLSFGLYQELDLYSSFPKSLLELFYEGTSELGKKYYIKGNAMQADLLGVYHIGLQKEVSRKLSLGGRVKLYSGLMNAKSTQNTGYLFTDVGTDNLYVHGFNDLNIDLKTSGVFDYKTKKPVTERIAQRLLFAGNKGLGVDLGATYKLDANTTLSASIIDLGFLYNSSNVNNYNISGDFETEGIGLVYDPNNPIDYWQDLTHDFKAKLKAEHTNNSYISWRPTQLTTAIQYSFGKKKRFECSADRKLIVNKNTSQKNIIGGLLRAQKRPGTVLYGASVYYQRNFADILSTRLSYTVDKFSYTNLGLSASLQVWKLNLFAGVNNLIGLKDLGKTNSLSAQFGLNVIID